VLIELDLLCTATTHHRFYVFFESTDGQRTLFISPLADRAGILKTSFDFGSSLVWAGRTSAGWFESGCSDDALHNA